MADADLEGNPVLTRQRALVAFGGDWARAEHDGGGWQRANVPPDVLSNRLASPNAVGASAAAMH